MKQQYWLIKSEPGTYSINDLARDKKTHWDGIRNYQARNYMRDDMHIGDQVIFYHSSTEPPAAVGLAEVCTEAYPDFTAWDPKDRHFDPKTNKDKPTWMMVDICFVKKFSHPISLETIKNTPALAGIMVAKRGARFSVQPVSKEHFDILCAMSAES